MIGEKELKCPSQLQRINMANHKLRVILFSMTNLLKHLLSSRPFNLYYFYLRFTEHFLLENYSNGTISEFKTNLEKVSDNISKFNISIKFSGMDKFVELTITLSIDDGKIKTWVGTIPDEDNQPSRNLHKNTIKS